MPKHDLTMHKLMGEHELVPTFNENIFETEEICAVCGFVKNRKPGNTNDPKHATDAYRYGMLSVEQALDKLGMAGVKNDLDVDLSMATPKDLYERLLATLLK